MYIHCAALLSYLFFFSQKRVYHFRYLNESISFVAVPPEPPEQSGRALYDRWARTQGTQGLIKREGTSLQKKEVQDYDKGEEPSK